MDPALVSSQIINGLAVGLTYALVGLGFNLLFGVGRVLNLAYGEIFMVGPLVMAVALGGGVLPESLPVLLFGSVIASTLAGLLVHYAAVAPLGVVTNLKSPRHLTALTSTIGASMVLLYLAQWWAGPYPRPFPTLPALDLPGLRLESSLALNIALALLVLPALWVLAFRTAWGREVRAMVDNSERAQQAGVRIGRIQFEVVALSSALAGLAGFLTATTYGAVRPTLGVEFGLKGLVVVIVGGLGRFGAGVVAAVLLGLGETLIAAFISPFYADALAYGALAVVLMVRADPVAKIIPTRK